MNTTIPNTTIANAGTGESMAALATAGPESICVPGAGGGAMFAGGDAGNLLPLFGESEQGWNKGLRAFLYLMGLLWSFVGVAIIADVFMAAIEVITSKEKVVIGPHGRKFTVSVWNGTVANLTLMALGSSAPEILLSMIEIAANDMMSGPLGPSTIIGSASFNLMAITAVCVLSVPSGEVRRIKDLPVFIITGFSSVFAYLWLIVILMGTSENIVSLGEALITFLFFPALVLVSYLADIGFFSKQGLHKGKVEPTGVSKVAVGVNQGGMTEDDVSMAIKKAKRSGAGLSEAEIETHAKAYAMSDKKRSRAEYRIGAIRQLFGGKQLNVYKTPPTTAGLPELKEEEAELASDEVKAAEKHVEFTANAWSFLEKEPTAEVTVKRYGSVDEPMEVKFETKDGTATAGKDYKPTSGVVKFAKGEAERKVQVPIIDDDEFEPDEFFTIELMEPSAGALGSHSSTKVIIINDDMPGVIGFEHGFYKVRESDGEILVNVVRRNGCAGKVTVQYATKDGSALAAKDYISKEGTLEFESGETSKTIIIKIIDDCKYEADEQFEIELTNATGGSTFSAETDGKTEKEIVYVKVSCDESVKGLADRISALMNADKMAMGTSAWSEQFMNALDPSGGEDMDVGIGGWIMHCVALPWKLMFALVPPTSFCNGWACFYVALMFIAILTAFIGDLASLFGCVLGIEDGITAITFVALGTSLPDTFASQQATICNQHADASITNITGSNSVNVFLGLGLPWLMAAAYWAAQACDDPLNALNTACITWKLNYGDASRPEIAYGFVVAAGDLGFSTGVFTVCACCTLGLLAWRRNAPGINAELGGPPGPAKVHAGIMVGLWLIFIALASWKIKDSATKAEAR
jgi:solute carrier family 8 (sodium/calcium exchanger)